MLVLSSCCSIFNDRFLLSLFGGSLDIIAHCFAFVNSFFQFFWTFFKILFWSPSCGQLCYFTTFFTFCQLSKFKNKKSIYLLPLVKMHKRRFFIKNRAFFVGKTNTRSTKVKFHERIFQCLRFLYELSLYTFFFLSLWDWWENGNSVSLIFPSWSVRFCFPTLPRSPSRRKTFPYHTLSFPFSPSLFLRLYPPYCWQKSPR